jgi:hypothetical protein
MRLDARKISCEVPRAPNELFALHRMGRRDLLAIARSNNVSTEDVTFRPSKQERNSKQRLFVPMYDELEHALSICPRRGVQVLTSANGRPWNMHTFRHGFREACREAGLPDHLRFHDLRGAVEGFRDAGASELEIRAVSGHSMKALPGALGSYIDSWRSLAEGAVRKRENDRRTKLQTAGATAGRSPAAAHRKSLKIWWVQ